MAALELASAQWGAEPTFPSRPRDWSPGPFADRDGFGALHGAHSASLFRGRSEDYLGVEGVLYGDPCYARRRERLTGKCRIDYDWGRRLMPEESEPPSVRVPGVIVDGRHVWGALPRVGVPPRGNYEFYAQARMTDLLTSLTVEPERRAQLSAALAYAEFETRVLLGRYQYLQAVEHYLMDVRHPSMEYGAVWRYLCLVVDHLWLGSSSIGEVGIDREIALYAVGASLQELGYRMAPERLGILASASTVVDWLLEAQELHDAHVASQASLEQAALDSAEP